MKKVFTVSILALAFATGFTCSKQETAPPAEMPEAPPAQEEMATPPADGAAAPAPATPPAEGTGH